MLSLSVAWAVLLLLALAPRGAAGTAQQVDVCIIGAGPSGIGAALALTEKGKTVALLEREDRAGGQTAPQYVDPATGFRTHQGAIYMTPPDYSLVIDYARRVGVGIEPYSSEPIGSSFYVASGNVEPVVITAPDSPYQARLHNLAGDFRGFVNVMRRFRALYKTYKPILFARGGMPAILRAAPELAQNMDAWLEQHDLSLLNPIAAQVLLNTGYGHLYTTSAASALQYLSPYSLTAGLGGSGIDTSKLITASDTGGYNHTLYMFTDDIGFAEVMQRLTRTLLPAGTLRVNVSIKSLQRPAADAAPGTPVVITYTQPGNGATTVRCGALINSVAQALPNLGFLGLDDVETALFRSVLWCRYFTVALMVKPKLREGMYLLPLPRDEGIYRRVRFSRLRGDHFEDRPALPLLSAIVDPSPYRGEATSLYSVNHGAANRPPGVPYSADPGLMVAYSYSDVPISAAEVAAKAVEMVNGTLRRASAEATFEFIYYPRVSESDLKAGWMARADALQGRRNTFHCGGLFTFWDVQGAFRSGFDLVDRFF